MGERAKNKARFIKNKRRIIMNSIISIITALIITISNLFGIVPLTEFFENLFSVEIFDEEKEIAKDETIELENGNTDSDVSVTKPVSDVRLVPAEGSTTIIDENTKAITGLEMCLTENALRERFLAVEGDGCYELELMEGYTGNWLGTGTKVKLYDNTNTAEPVEIYIIVIYGDVNGDSIADAADGTETKNEALEQTNWSRQDCEDYDLYKTLAADLNKNGVVEYDEGKIISDVSIGFSIIDQTNANVILM